jgi:hypothetical protein
MSDSAHHPRHRRFRAILLGAVALAGSVYVGFHLSPSSYGIVLRELGAPGLGLVAGVPRAERGDEFAWQTPLLQMTVRSGFGRYDLTPPYFEDLRGLYGMPVLDWAIVFKPQFWAFFIVPPAVAYSFYHFFLITAFVVGFTALFVRMGGRHVDSLLMALVLFFASYTQYWWDGASNFFFPFFPWIVLSLIWNIRFLFRLALFFWLLVTALLTYFYPPNAIAFGFVAVILWFVVRPELFRWKYLLAVGATAVVAAGVVFLYLRGPIAAIATTTYPGQRISGGGGIPFWMWMTQFIPTAQVQDHVALNPGAINICEISMLGSIFALVAVLFLPWRELWNQSDGRQRRGWLLLLAGFVATQAWMMLPLPHWAGYPLLWHRVPPGRMVVAGGLFLMVLVFVLSQNRPLRITPRRVALLTLCLFASWFAYKRPLGIDLIAAYKDWVIIVPVIALAFLINRGRVSPREATTAILATSLAIGGVSFGGFNPVQRTDPIFAPIDSPVLRALDAELERDGRGFVVLPWGTSFFACPGLALIGRGYPCLSYATFVPALELWKRIYPDLTPEEQQLYFNNAGCFAFGEVERPQRVPGTLVTLAPIAPFTRPGATVCDFIPQSRQALASRIGCLTPAERPPASASLK